MLYAAVDSALWKCYRISYDGSGGTDAGRAGEATVQVVDTGSAKPFDLMIDAFSQVTGAATGVFPAAWQQVACQTSAGGAEVAVLDAQTDAVGLWWLRVVLHNLERGVSSARLAVGGAASHAMTRSGALWDGSVGGATKPIAVVATLDDGSVLELDISSDPKLAAVGWADPSAAPPLTPVPPPVSTPPASTLPPATIPAPQVGKKQLVAFLENWLACPSLDKVRGYDKVIVSFAVSYTWSPGKNQCDQQCAISAPATCGNQVRKDLIDQWRQAGTKVLISFGGAGMGGSWAGDQNDCWEYCFGEVGGVVSQLVSIVDDQGFDGVDIDYEYFHSDQSAEFLKGLTEELRRALPADKIVSHAPMDGDIVPGQPYFNVLKEVASSIDYLLPQYYNGAVIRPASDLGPAVAHMGHLVNDIFAGDASKVVFGFCISDCAGTGSNVNGAQAASVLAGVSQSFPDYGGAFFWAASHDSGWSDPVRQLLASAASPTAAPTAAAPTEPPAPTPSAVSPTAPPAPAPSAGSRPAACAEDVGHHGSHEVGPCFACLANGLCISSSGYESKDFCLLWPANVWCGEPALVASLQGRVRRHAFLGAASSSFVQVTSPLSVATCAGDAV